MKEKKKLEWSKKLLIILFINFFLLEIFIFGITCYSFNLGFAIGQMPDYTPLITLITAVIGETLSYGMYCAKAKAENTVGGIKYDTAMKDLESEEEEAKG